MSKSMVSTGSMFGDWLVVGEASVANGKRRWVCRCVCGTERAVYETHLVRGNSKSCSRQGHKLPKSTPGWSSWQAMKERCYRSNHPAFHRYGGRGIGVCARWLFSFENFYEDMGPRPAGTTLERINGDGHYEPGNCRWATPQEQQNNTCTNRFLSVDGEALTIAQLARKRGVHYETMYSRLKRAGQI